MPCERHSGWSGSITDGSFFIGLSNCYCSFVFILFFYFMILEVPTRQLDVWSLAPLDSIDARLANSQGDRLVLLL